ncbi:Crp/Fnr family transcriptional regulator [Fusibacter ferrireducens]|nr:Crp/Fnr family transcriptional regulator [Fusibacter ferrireducens]
MNLTSEWAKYENESTFNLSILPKEIVDMGTWITYAPKSFIVTRGDFPKYLYFIKSGTALGTKHYTDGNEYNYFQIDKSNGNVGMLEVFAKKNSYVATVISVTELVALRVESAVVYDFVMTNQEMLRRCITLIAEDLYKRSGDDGIFYYLDGLNRLRYYLIHYYDTHKDEGKRVVIEAQYEDIAKNIGVSIRTVGRSIQKLKALEEIASKNKKMIITDEKYKLLLKNLWS